MRALRAIILPFVLATTASFLFAQKSPLPLPERTGPTDFTESPIKPDISGYVRFPQGKGTGDPVLVRLETSTGTILRQSWTAPQGYFTFPEVSCGSYVLALDVSGYHPVRISVEHSFIPPGAIFLNLEPLETKSLVAEGGTPSTPESAIPPKAWAEYAKGLDALSKRKADKSAPHFRKATEMAPNFGDAYFQLGLAYFQQRAYAEAGQVLEKAVTLSNKNAQAYALLGAAYRQQNRYQDAVQALERSLALEANSWRAHLELGETLLKLGRVSEAYPHVARAHWLNTGVASTHLALYNTFILRDDYKAARAELEEFLRLFPDSPLAARARQQREALTRVLPAKH